MTTSPSTALRAAMITALKADAGVQATALGGTPRVLNRAPPGTTLPFLRIASSFVAWDCTGTEADEERGGEHAISLFIEGEQFGDKEGEAIFEATRRFLRSWAPTLSGHRLVNIVFEGEEVGPSEDLQRYFGLQRWRAVTEETD